MSSHHSFASPAEALRALFAAWPADRGEGTGFAEAYIIAIQGYSLKSIDNAVKRIIRGEVSDIDRRFLPSPAQLGNVCAYLEKLYAPPHPVKALPATGDGERTAEEQARIDAVVGKWRKDNGMERGKGEIITDREAVPAERLAKLDAAVRHAEAKLKAGEYRLSAEALAALRPMMTDAELADYEDKQKGRSERRAHLDSVSVDDPATQYEAWDNTPTHDSKGTEAA
jgi:hypothetical protein